MVKVKDVKHEKTTRKSFSKIGDFIEMPNLIKVQRDSYEWFLNEGLGEVLREVSPIHSRRSKRKRCNILNKITCKRTTIQP